jgi:type II secretory pathway pseudopilin PulG
LQLVLAWLGILAFPCGTAVSILVLIYLYKPGVKVLYSGKRPEELSHWERAQLVRLRQSAAGTVAIIALAIAFFMIPILGIIAAIAIPSLLRARVSANEATTIGDIRTVISAEAAYQSINAGYYDKLECLSGPGRCIPGYGGPSFLSDQWPEVKSGYRRRFHAGPAAEPTPVRESHASPSSLQSFAYVAIPASVNQTGVRGFCGDDTGIICYTLDGSAPAVRDGRCVLESCRPLQ